jgi:BCD family chlorophyll transporter-like MFS transporter
MMGLAGAGGEESREGVRMGVWGAAQALAFGLGGFLGAVGLDVLRAGLHDTPRAFLTVFTLEAALFVLSAVLAARLGQVRGVLAVPAAHAGLQSARP